MKRLMTMMAPLLAAMVAAADDVRLEDLDVYSFRETKHEFRPRAKKSVRDTPLKVGGRVYENGLGLKTEENPIWGEFFPNGRAKRFEVAFGLDAQAGKNAKAILNVYGDEKLLAMSGEVAYGEAAKEMKADLAGVKVVKIEVTDAGSRAGAVFADLCEAKFVMEDGATLLDDPSCFSPQLGILTPKQDGKPRINGPALYGARPNKALLYRVPVSGDKPLDVTVEGLPEGTYFDKATSMLRGTTPAKKGEYPLVITATNAKGSVTKDFRLVVGDKIGLTPPMGWNSWNCFAPNVSDERVRAQAEAMFKLGLVEHGWQYLVIDDYWERNAEKGKKPGNEHLSGPTRDENGNIQLNARFPDMKALADHIHSLGLKIGLYSSPGPTTCGGCEGSWLHEWQDARQYAAWGFDYLKHDWCSGGTVKFGDARMFKMLPWLMMGKALKEQDRDIYYSLSIGSLDIPGYGEQVYANSWRITGDVFNSWMHIRRSMAAERYCWFYTHPGAWCDPDMLVLQTMGPKRGHRLTPNEQYTHISMWCLFSAPLMIGCDIPRMNDFTLSLLTNDEVLDVNQDSLGLCAACVQKPNGGLDEVWAKPMSDGSVAAGILNLSYAPRKVKMCFKKLGMRGKWRIRDLWRQKDEGEFEDCYEVEIPGHATQLVRIWPTEGARFDKDVQDIRDFAWMNEIEEFRPLKPTAGSDCVGCEGRKAMLKHVSEADAGAGFWRNGERQPLWPSLEQMPDRQDGQIGAMTDERKLPGFKAEEHRMPYIEWFDAPAKPNGGCMILVSGGSYECCCDVGLVRTWRDTFTELGYQTVNLVYRTPRPKDLPIHQTAWEDGQRAVRLVRSQAEKRGFKADKIGAIGMSAGGHLVCLLATSSLTPAYSKVDALDDLPCNLNIAIANAPAYNTLNGATGSQTQKDGLEIIPSINPCFAFDAQTCPMSLHHGGTDPWSPNGSTLFYREMRKRKVPCDLHLYADRAHGAHGFERALEFLNQMEFVSKLPPKRAQEHRFFPGDTIRTEKELLWPEGKRPDPSANQKYEPYLVWFIPEKLRTKAIQIVFPGGGYGFSNFNGEGAPVAYYLNGKGMTTVVVQYRCPRPVGQPKHLSAWQDAQRAIRLVRSEAPARGLDPNRIGVMGFSAGGHLTLMTATNARTPAYEPVDEVDKLPCTVQWACPTYPAYALTDGADKPNAGGGNGDDAVIVPEFSFDADTPPMCFSHGDADGYAAMNSVKCWEKLRMLGRQSDLHSLATRNHCFQFTASPGTGAWTWMDQVWDFLSRKGLNQ